MKNKFYPYIQNLQDQICKGLEDTDGATKFREDIWERLECGGGRTDVKKKNKVANLLKSLKIEGKITTVPGYYWRLV